MNIKMDVLKAVAAMLFVIMAFSPLYAAQGDTEMRIAGGYSMFNMEPNDDDEEDSYSLDVLFGEYATDNVFLGVQGLGAWGDDVDLYGLGLNAQYQFAAHDANVIPYAGGQLNFVCVENSFDEDGWMWGPLAGVKMPVNQSTDLFVEYQYQMFDGDADNLIDDAHAIKAGLAWKF